MVDAAEVLTLQDTEAQYNNKLKKKRIKFIDSTLRELPQNASNDDKFEYICQKYYELHQELKENSLKNKQFEQNVQQIRIERDQLQNERNRLILQKDKLETLCRELQKQNKIIQEESLSRARIEDEKRREVSDHFQTSITSIQNQLCDYQSKNVELRKENQELAEKLGEFIKQHEKREEHVDKLIETRSLELKLSEAKLNKAHCLLDQEKAKGQQKILQLEEEVKYLKNRLEIQKTIEDKLREQIIFYKEKYQSFNKTMSESRRMFDTAKEEMEKLGKRIQLSESDAVAWQGKWEVSQRSLLELAEQHKKEVLESVNAKKQVEKLSGLCRALKAEVNELREQQAQHQQLQQKRETENKNEKQHEHEQNSRCSEPHEAETKKNINDPVNNSTIKKQKQEFIGTVNNDSVNGSDFNIHKTDGNVESSTVTSITTVSNAVHDESDCLSNSLTQCTKDMNELKLDSNADKVISNSEHPVSE
ncbi:hypothetical protein MN116_008292 [Schistosoma mekongi]|uniref:Alpha-taxilin n=1 Tax=Schistosoma mekongi TaxID=38744 RepID=A0AAE1Z5W5_SCHME|nr:hypothetical protein MN116_008292 [Schistosoma mekongi]